MTGPVKVIQSYEMQLCATNSKVLTNVVESSNIPSLRASKALRARREYAVQWCRREDSNLHALKGH